TVAGTYNTVQVGSLTATFTVPASPSSSDQTAVFLFPGIQGASTVIGSSPVILQTVAQYGPSPSFPTNDHWIALSYFCPLSGTCQHSPAIDIVPGDQITGTITSSNCSGTPVACDWTVKTTAPEGTQVLSLTAVSALFQLAIGGELEAHGVTNC